MNQDELTAIENRRIAVRYTPLWSGVPEELVKLIDQDIPALITEVERLQAEINRVAVFLAIHGVDGYTIKE